MLVIKGFAENPTAENGANATNVREKELKFFENTLIPAVKNFSIGGIL